MSAHWDRDSILKLGRDFMTPRVLLTAVEVGLFTLLEEQALTADEVAAAIGGDPRATRIVLDALAATGILAKEEGRFQLPADLVPVLGTGAGNVVPMLLHQVHLWQTWSGLTEVVRTGAPVTPPARSSPQDSFDSFIGAMHVVGMGAAPKVVARVDLSRVRRALDLGGGSGVYTIAMLQAWPAMRGVLFDRGPVIEIARGHLAAAGVLDRVDLVAGDFYRDPLPGGNDLVWLSAIIHQNSPSENRAMYARIAESLVSGGMLVIRDHVMEPTRIRPRAGALFAVNMLVGTPGGDTYTFEEIEGPLREAGFSDVRLLAGGEMMDSLVVAIRS